MGKREEIVVDKRRKRKYRRLSRYEKKAKKAAKSRQQGRKRPGRKQKKERNASLRSDRKAHPLSGVSKDRESPIRNMLPARKL